MAKPKLNYRFHNPNEDDASLINALLRVCIEANMKRVEAAIIEAAINCDETDAKTDLHNCITGTYIEDKAI